MTQLHLSSPKITIKTWVCQSIRPENGGKKKKFENVLKAIYLSHLNDSFLPILWNKMNVRHIRLACEGGQLLQWTLLFETLIKMYWSYKKKKKPNYK